MRRCNHCNGQLGLIVHRKWDAAVLLEVAQVSGYQPKLQEERRAKLRHLAFLAPEVQTNNWAGPSK